MQPYTHCPSCGSTLPVGARACPTCGRGVALQEERPYQPQQFEATSMAPRPTAMSTQDERNWALFCHLAGLANYLFPFAGLIATLIIWSTKKDQSAFVNIHGKESLNFQISFHVYLIIVTAVGLFLGFSLLLVFIGFLILMLMGLLLTVIALAHIVLTIIASVKASNSEYYEYPLTIRFVQ